MANYFWVPMGDLLRVAMGYQNFVCNGDNETLKMSKDEALQILDKVEEPRPNVQVASLLNEETCFDHTPDWNKLSPVEVAEDADGVWIEFEDAE